VSAHTIHTFTPEETHCLDALTYHSTWRVGVALCPGVMSGEVSCEISAHRLLSLFLHHVPGGRQGLATGFWLNPGECSESERHGDKQRRLEERFRIVMLTVMGAAAAKRVALAGITSTSKTGENRGELGRKGLASAGKATGLELVHARCRPEFHLALEGRPVARINSPNIP